jgi:papain like cysteine protease AvrRpt2
MANPFEMVKQTEMEWCWAAVGASMSQYFSPNSALVECRVATLVTGDHSCCDPIPPDSVDIPEKLQDVLGKLQALQVDAKANFVLPFSDIQTQINAGLPVCARITWFGEFAAHFVVIYGWGISASGDQWVDVGDPFFLNSTVLYQNFVNSYQDAGEWTDTFLLKQA